MSVRQPGGWLSLENSRIARWLVIGAITLSGGGGAFAVYGQFQGAQAEHFIEGTLDSAPVNTVTFSMLNPLPEDQSGAILPTDESIVFVSEVPSPVSRLSICTATGASQPCTKTSGSSNVMSGVYLNVANRALLLSHTGSLAENGVPAILAPRNYASTSRKYLNFTYTVGSGQTVSGLAAAFARFKVVPCNLDGVGC